MRNQCWLILSTLGLTCMWTMPIAAQSVVNDPSNLGTASVYNSSSSSWVTSQNKTQLPYQNSAQPASTQSTFPPLGSNQAAFPPLGSASSNATTPSTFPALGAATQPANVAPNPVSSSASVQSPAIVASAATFSSGQTTALGNSLANQCVSIGQSVNNGGCGFASLSAGNTGQSVNGTISTLADLKNINSWFQYPALVNVGTAQGPSGTNSLIVFYQSSLTSGVCVTFPIPPTNAPTTSQYIQQAGVQSQDGQPDGGGSTPNDGLKVTGRLAMPSIGDINANPQVLGRNPPQLKFCTPP